MNKNTKTDILQINNQADLMKHIRDGIGEKAAHSMMGGTFLDNSVYNCSAIEAEKIACEEFYEGVLLCDEQEGFIKLNITKEDIMDVLWSIFSNDPTID